jgi:hypothetical protein
VFTLKAEAEAEHCRGERVGLYSDDLPCLPRLLGTIRSRTLSGVGDCARHEARKPPSAVERVRVVDDGGREHGQRDAILR